GGGLDDHGHDIFAGLADRREGDGRKAHGFARLSGPCAGPLALRGRILCGRAVSVTRWGEAESGPASPSSATARSAESSAPWSEPNRRSWVASPAKATLGSTAPGRCSGRASAARRGADPIVGYEKPQRMKGSALQSWMKWSASVREGGSS